MKVPPALAWAESVACPANASRSVTATTTACLAKCVSTVDADQDVVQIPIAPIVKSVETANAVALLATLPEPTEFASMLTNA